MYLPEFPSKHCIGDAVHSEYAYPDTGLFCLFGAFRLISNTQSETALVERPN